MYPSENVIVLLVLAVPQVTVTSNTWLAVVSIVAVAVVSIGKSLTPPPISR